MNRNHWLTRGGTPAENIPQIPASVSRTAPYGVEKWLIAVLRHAAAVELAIAPGQQGQWGETNRVKWELSGRELSVQFRMPVEVIEVIFDPGVSLASL